MQENRMGVRAITLWYFFFIAQSSAFFLSLLFFRHTCRNRIKPMYKNAWQKWSQGFSYPGSFCASLSVLTRLSYPY